MIRSLLTGSPLLGMLPAIVVAILAGAANLLGADAAAAGMPALPSRDALGIWWAMGAAVVVPSLLAGVNQAIQIWQRLTRSKIMDVAITADPRSLPRTRGDCIGIHEKDREWIRRVEAATQAFANGAAANSESVRTELQTRINTLSTSMDTQFSAINRELGGIGASLKILLGRGV